MEYLHTAAERLPYLRAEAKRYGLAFTRVSVNINDEPAYRLYCRKTGSRKSGIDTLSGWYELQSRRGVFEGHAL